VTHAGVPASPAAVRYGGVHLDAGTRAALSRPRGDGVASHSDLEADHGGRRDVTAAQATVEEPQLHGAGVGGVERRPTFCCGAYREQAGWIPSVC
jgi:hypothetical protein